MKIETLEQLRIYFGRPVKVWHRAVSKVYLYEGILLPFNQCRFEVQLKKEAESGKGLMKADNVKSMGFNHIVKVETDDGKE